MGFDRGMISHVRVVAILSLVQASLEILAAIGLIVTAIVFLFMGPGPWTNGQQPPNGGPSPDMAPYFIAALYGGLGLFILAIGGTRLFAGIRLYHFRSRTLGIVSLAMGIGTVFTCYCLPTALALAIYGLIVLLNEPVSAAFQQVAAGESASDIIDTH